MAQTKADASRFRSLQFLLRVFTVVFAAITIILFGVALQLVAYSSSSEVYADGLSGLCLAIFGLPWPAYTIFFGLLAIIPTVIAKSCHPGFYVCVDVLGWTLNWAMGVTMIYFGEYLDFTEYACDPEFGLDEAECSDTRRLAGMWFSGSAFMMIYGTAHLFLLVEACKATHERRISKKRESFMELGGVSRDEA